MIRILSMTFVICTVASLVAAQSPDRKPGPEHTRLGYFAGQWKMQGESEGMKYTSNLTCDWFNGGFHLICRSQGSGDFGVMHGQVMMTYDNAAKAYSLHSINSFGSTLTAKGSLAEKAWTWNTELNGDNGPFKARMTMTEESPAAYSFKMEGLLDGKNWIVLESGHVSKASK